MLGKLGRRFLHWLRLASFGGFWGCAEGFWWVSEGDFRLERAWNGL